MTAPGDPNLPAVPSSGLGPLGDIQMLAAILRSDGDDVASYVRVLTGTLGSALPAGVVQVDYERSMGERLSGKPGHPVRLIIRGVEGEIELFTGKGGRSGAMVRKVVGGVVISRKEIGIDEWVRLLAAELSARAQNDAAARQALASLLGM